MKASTCETYTSKAFPGFMTTKFLCFLFPPILILLQSRYDLEVMMLKLYQHLYRKKYRYFPYASERPASWWDLIQWWVLVVT